VIRLVTLDPHDPVAVQKLCRLLYQAFGVGCDSAGDMDIPAGMTAPFDAEALVAAAPAPRLYPDDRVLYLTARPLKERILISGTAPTHGFAQYGGQRALITTSGVKDLDASLKLVGRHAMHQLGHCWDVHHCLDPRCAMYPPWTPSFGAGDAIFDTFCREKSEQKIRLAKS
jgi:archaemetzincin